MLKVGPKQVEFFIKLSGLFLDLLLVFFAGVW